MRFTGRCPDLMAEDVDMAVESADNAFESWAGRFYDEFRASCIEKLGRFGARKCRIC